jgi:ElaB/YqjD/DUF883 family membrane-anchored ribosome-binding protein
MIQTQNKSQSGAWGYPRQTGGTSVVLAKFLANGALSSILIVAAIVGVIALVSGLEAGPTSAARLETAPISDGAPEIRHASSGAELADRLAAQQEGIEHLSSKVDALAEKLAEVSAVAGKAAAAEKLSSMRGKAEQQVTAARSRAAAEDDLQKLRAYIKDVADSVAVLDTQMSDPAVLQKKLEHQRALTRP